MNNIKETPAKTDCGCSDGPCTFENIQERLGEFFERTSCKIPEYVKKWAKGADCENCKIPEEVKEFFKKEKFQNCEVPKDIQKFFENFKD